MPLELVRFLLWVRDNAAADEYLDVEMLVKEFLGLPLPWARFDGELEYYAAHERCRSKSALIAS